MSDDYTIGRAYSELSLAESAELDRQRSLDKIAVSKQYPDAKEFVFNGTSAFSSKDVNTSSFQGIEFIAKQNAMLSKSVVSARLWHTVKRPGRPRIRVYSNTLYGFTLEHLIRMVNDMSPKSVMDKIGNVLKMQEGNRPMPRPKRVG